MGCKYRILYVEMAHGVGGSVISLYQLLRGLDRSRYEPIVLFYKDNAYVKKFQELGVETIVWDKDQGGRRPATTLSPLGRFRKLLRKLPPGFYHGLGFYIRMISNTMPLAWRICQLVRAYRIDLIHGNDLLGCNREAVIAAKLAKRPCLCHIRAFEKYTTLDRFLAQWVDKFIFISQAISQSCVAQGVNPLRGIVVYNALDLTEFLQGFDGRVERACLGLSHDDKVVGIVGRLVRWKGQDVFLRAMAQVASSIPDLRCLIIGDAETGDHIYRAELETLAQELRISDKVQFLGWRSDIARLLSAIDVLVHCSLEPEPFGRVIIEGMAAGKAVVAAAAGACLEIIEDGVSGVLVPPGDANALARAVEGLLQNPHRRQAMGIIARHQAALRFSIEEHVRQIEQIYAEILEKGN